MRCRQFADPSGVVHDAVRAGTADLHVTRCEKEGTAIHVTWTNEELVGVPRGTATTCVQCIAGRRRG